jgi:hypothetical protein
MWGKVAHHRIWKRRQGRHRSNNSWLPSLGSKRNPPKPDDLSAHIDHRKGGPAAPHPRPTSLPGMQLPLSLCRAECAAGSRSGSDFFWPSGAYLTDFMWIQSCPSRRSGPRSTTSPPNWCACLRRARNRSTLTGRRKIKPRARSDSGPSSHN